MPESFAHRAGAQLAISLLEELEANSALVDECQISAPIELDRPQRNILLEKIGRARSSGQDALEGFTAILCDYIASTAGGWVPEASYYRNRRTALRELAAVTKPGPV